MLDELRLFLALTLFCLGIYLVWDLLVNGFEVIVFVAVLVCFVAAHYVKPRRVEEDDPSMLWEVIGFLIDIPFKTIALLLRAISRPLKSDVDGFDL